MPAGVRLTRLAAVVIWATAGAARGQAAPSAEVRCDYSQKIECTAAGCQVTPVGGGYLRLAGTAALVAATSRATMPANLPVIQVCDARGCTPMVVRASRSGVFVNIAQDGGAHFVKVAVADIPPGIRKGDFVEVAARLLTTTTYVGSCPALAP